MGILLVIVIDIIIITLYLENLSSITKKHLIHTTWKMCETDEKKSRINRKPKRMTGKLEVGTHDALMPQNELTPNLSVMASGCGLQ